MILVTGGAGFIGSNFVTEWFNSKIDIEPLVILDKFTYAASGENHSSVFRDPRYSLVYGDVNDENLVNGLLEKYKPRAILHFAAETDVDKSIRKPTEFLHANVMGVFCLLQCSLKYWQKLHPTEARAFRFLNVSTDEVYGPLNVDAPACTENSPYFPNNPYAASKAAGDHFVKAWFGTYGLPVLVTHCSNNYGPFQFPEKLIPVVISKALNGEPIPIYGDGKCIRDWLYVSDHCAAIRKVLEDGAVGQVYNIGGSNEMQNIEVVKLICDFLDDKSPETARIAGGRHKQLINYVSDRPGHDRRYSLDTRKIRDTLGWKPEVSFIRGIEKTIDWYLTHRKWLAQTRAKIR